MKQLTAIGRIALTALASAILTTLAITACGGGSSISPINQARAFIFNSNPVGLRAANGVGDSDVGVNVPQNGQVGNLTVDAHGMGSGADDGKVGITSTASGQIEAKLIHADGTQTILPLSCTLGVSSADAKVHCEDNNAAST